MKKSVLAFAFLFTVSFSYAQQPVEMGMAFQFIHPQGGMARNIEKGFGVTVDGAYHLKTPFAIGMELSYTNYGYDKTKQHYTFDDGSVTETYVNVDNSFINLNATAKYFLRNNRTINPYLSTKLGYSWYRTVLTIEDPEDETACHPLESDVLSRDGTFVASVGGGVRLDFASLFKRMPTNFLFFDLSVHGVQGGKVNYMNADNHNPPNQPQSSDVMASFINRQTQVVHEHHVGYLYTSIASMMDYRFGIVFRPGNWSRNSITD